jgi:1,2-diacylglycerol 3-alpha-glucosyltransferase
MKIVHICICGLWSEKYAYHDNLLPKFHKNLGNDVTIIAPTYAGFFGYDGKIVEEEAGIFFLDSGIKLIRVKPLIKSYAINQHLHLFHSIKQYVIDEKPDFIFVHDVYSFNYLSLITVKHLFPKTKIVFDNHADSINSTHNFLSKFLNGFIYRFFLTNRLNRISDIFYGVTPSRCDFLHSMYGIPRYKIKLLVMGADDEKMHLDQKILIRKEVRDKYNITDSDFLIVTGGKIDEKKNIHLLAEAVKEITCPNVKILLFGTICESLKDYVNNILCNRVIYIGWVNSDCVYNYFYAADLVVFPGLHSVLWEQAVACGIPCAFSDLSGFKHINFNDNCIFLKNSTVEYYKETIMSIYNDKAKYNQLKINAQDERSLDFTYSRIAKKVIEDSFGKNYDK